MSYIWCTYVERNPDWFREKSIVNLRKITGGLVNIRQFNTKIYIVHNAYNYFYYREYCKLRIYLQSIICSDSKLEVSLFTQFAEPVSNCLNRHHVLLYCQQDTKMIHLIGIHFKQGHKTHRPKIIISNERFVYIIWFLFLKRATGQTRQ